VNLYQDENQTYLQDLATTTPFSNNYFWSTTYLAQSASKKQADLWTQISSTVNQVGSWPNAAGMFTESMNTTFDAKGDAMPAGVVYGYRTKYIHAVGAVGKVKLVSSGKHPFTGIFKGADFGLVRLSSGNKPSLDGSAPLAPGMGLKFLKDGKDSSNLVAMFSVNGQPGDWNFFSNDFSNHIPDLAPTAALVVLAEKFSTATPYIQSVGLTNFSAYT
jgi:hypothetical protein